jgi:hypothetical protein
VGARKNTTDAAKTSSANTLLIRGIEIPVTTVFLEQVRLKFYPDNPRVYSVLRSDGKTPSQEEIEKRLLEMEHVKALIQDIRINKGLIEPLIVKDETFEVLEGNSRLAAYRFLAKSDPLRWTLVKCTVLPRNVDESLVFTLLGQFHIKGKKDWAPYEQAGFLYRRYEKQHTDMKALALEIGISLKKVKHLVETYQFMVENNEEDINRWSYYDEYLRSNKIRKAREKFPELDKLVVKKIRSEEIERAMDLREQLPVICANGRVLNKFVSGKTDFQGAFDSAVESGGDRTHLKTVKKFREWVTRPEVESHLSDYEGKVRAALVYELNKIEARVRHVAKKLEHP